MTYLFFPHNGFSFIPGYHNAQMFQNYNNQMTGMIPTFVQPYQEFTQWRGIFQMDNNSLIEKPSANYQLRTSDGSSECQVVLQSPDQQVTPTKKQKKISEKDISSAKKNSQSNIINQFYSYFGCRERSQKIVRKAILATIPGTIFQQKILLLFYNTIKAINSKRGRKYVNRSMMLNYFTPDIMLQNLPEIKQKIQKIDFISLDELCQVFRRSCHAFLKIVSIPAIMTSKRITGVSKEEHFKKRRIILKAIMGY